MTGKPIVLNKLQMRLAIELAAQEAYRAELRKQVSDQLADTNIIVTDGAIDIDLAYARFDPIEGREVIWE